MWQLVAHASGLPVQNPVRAARSMGNKVSRKKEDPTARQNPFKLFEYTCQSCSSKRPIQYFYRNGVFLQQTPRVVCGNCNTSILAEPFKTVDYACPTCSKKKKARLPAKPMPLNMYNVSVVSCQCGFKGEAPVGKLMDVVCGTCWTSVKELTGVWTEDGEEVKSFCQTCKSYQRSFAKAPKKQTPQNTADMEYTCESCFRVRPLQAEELLRNQGLAYCSLCGWVGYPEIRERKEGEPGKGAESKAAKAKKKPTVSEESKSVKTRPALGWGGGSSSSSRGQTTTFPARSNSPGDTLAVLPA